MSQIIKDIEEALKREIASVTTQYNATKSNKTLQTTFDVFTGKVKAIPIRANFYNEEASPNAVIYPRVDIRFDRLEEDRTSGRMLSIWEDLQNDSKFLIEPNRSRPRVYEPVVSGSDGSVSGSILTIPRIKFNKVLSNFIVKLVSGNNQGTYTIDNLDEVAGEITLSTELVLGLQNLSFNESTRKLYILDYADIFSVRAGDIFEDSLGAQFKILSGNVIKRELYLSGSAVPDLSVGSKIIRSGDVLSHEESGTIRYIIMDPSKPKVSLDGCYTYVTDEWLSSNPLTPFNYYSTVEVKNKERQAHIEFADRMTSTIINRPRRAIEILLRNPLSIESNIIGEPDIGIGTTIQVDDASQFCVNQSIYIINRYRVSDNNQIVDIDYDTNTLTLRNKLPREYNFENEAILVANATLKRWNFFLDQSPIMGEDSPNQFYSQEYIFRTEGWVADKTGETIVYTDPETGEVVIKEGVEISKGITGIEGIIETPNHAVEEFDLD